MAAFLGAQGAKKIHRLLAVFVFALVPAALQADSVSYVGTLSTSTDVIEETFTLTSPATIGLQTWGFGGTGGGTNAAGTPISAGGTDPFLAIFFGTGSTATILTDGMGNPFGTSLDLANYGNPNVMSLANERHKSGMALSRQHPAPDRTRR